MPAARTPAISDDRTFLAFLPVLCAVWADGLMEDAELSAVSRALDKAEWMTAEGRSRVLDWLDPALPPSPAVYGAALEKLRDGQGDSRTLAMAGVSMAGRVASWRADALATLVQLELALGVAGAEALRELTRVEGMAVPAVRGAPAGTPAVCVKIQQVPPVSTVDAEADQHREVQPHHEDIRRRHWRRRYNPGGAKSTRPAAGGSRHSRT